MKKYLIKLDQFDINWIKYCIDEDGFYGALDKFIEDINVPKRHEYIQTVSHTYKNYFTRIDYLIDKIEDQAIKVKYIDKVLEQHKANLDYEKENPPIVYERRIRRTKKRDVPNTNINDLFNDTTDTKVKVSTSEKKLANKAAKLNKLSFKLK